MSAPLRGTPLVIAHRGASAYRPENTLPAYALAVEQRADMIEIDLHLTRDRRIAVAHDAELDRLGAAGEIADVDYAELSRLDAGDGESVPHLEAVLDAFGGRVPFNLELKWGAAGDYPGLEAAVLEAVQSRGLLGEMLFSSFHPSILGRLRDREPSARLALLVHRSVEGALDRAEELGAEAVNPHFALVAEHWVGTVHDRGLAVFPYTVDAPPLMESLLDAGVDGMFSNRPDVLRRVVDSRGA